MVSKSAMMLAAAMLIPVGVGGGIAMTQAVPTAIAQAPQDTAALAPASGEYRIDPSHAQVRMTWNHLGLSNPGATFEDVQGVVRINQANPAASSVSVTIPVRGLDSGVPALDTEFQSDKFFDAARHPAITFVSNQVRTVGLGRRFQVAGDLTVRGVTRPVVLDAVLNGAGTHPMTGTQTAGFSATTRIKRSDFGLNVALPMVSDDVDVEITLEVNVPKP